MDHEVRSGVLLTSSAAPGFLAANSVRWNMIVDSPNAAAGMVCRTGQDNLFQGNVSDLAVSFRNDSCTGTVGP
jgi:hypothetical protein